MVGLTKEQRGMLIDKIPDAANLALGALVFAQFLDERRFSPALAVSGIGVWLGLLVCGLLLGQEVKGD